MNFVKLIRIYDKKLYLSSCYFPIISLLLFVLLTIETPEGRHKRRSGVLIVNVEHISYLFLAFLLLTLNMGAQEILELIKRNFRRLETRLFIL